MLKLYARIRTALDVFRDEQGQDLIEYALLGALIAVACVASMGTLANKVTTVFTNIGADLT